MINTTARSPRWIFPVLLLSAGLLMAGSLREARQQRAIIVRQEEILKNNADLQTTISTISTLRASQMQQMLKDISDVKARLGISTTQASKPGTTQP